MSVNLNTLKSVYVESICAFDTDSCFGDNVNVLGTATAFYYKYNEKMYLVTNKHVVTGKDTFNGSLKCKMGSVPTAIRAVVNVDVVNQDNSHEYFEVTLVYELYEDISSPIDKLWHEHHGHPMIDVVVLDVTERYYKSIEVNKEVRSCKSCDWYHYDYCSESKMHNVTDNVFVVGFPFGYQTTGADGWYAIWNNGTIASEYTKQLVVPVDALLRKGVYAELDAFLIDAKTWEGQSGSPVLTNISLEKAELLGVYGGRTDKNSSLGYVWKIKLVNDIVGQIQE